MVKRFIAMTLAEVMVTFVVLGVVVALVAPGLKKYKDKQTIAVQLKSGYATLNKALDMAMASDIDLDIGKIDGNSLFLNYMIPNMNIQKKCSSANMSECIPDSAQDLPFKPSNAVILASGFTIANNARDFLIDANGTKNPNMGDVDIYHYKLAKKNALADISSDEDSTDSDSSADVDNDATWQFVPVGKAKEIIENGWKIKHF